MAASPLRAELRATLAVAAPLAAGNLAQMVMGFVNMVMVGRLGGEAIAATGLGGSLYFTLGMVLQAVLTGAAPLAAHADGAGERRRAAQIGGDALALAALMALPMIGTVLLLDRLLLALGYEPGLAGRVGEYLRAIVWAVPAFLGFGTFRSQLAALARTRPVMVLLLAFVPINAALNWTLIYGHLGMPALGVAGAGYASAATSWLLFAALSLWMLVAPGRAWLRPFRHMLTSRRSGIVDIVRLGLPIGGIRALETGVFTFSAVLMGLLGAASLSASNIVLNCASISFMVPMGIGQAAMVRVAYELGARRPASARRAAAVALSLGVGFMTGAGVLLWLLPRPIAALYIDIADPANAEVVAVALDLFFIAALFQVVRRYPGDRRRRATRLQGY